MSLEAKVKEVIISVLDVEESEIKAEGSLMETLEVDSTEMVEITVSLKKEFGVELGDNDIKKQNSLTEIVEILKGKGVE